MQYQLIFNIIIIIILSIICTWYFINTYLLVFLRNTLKIFIDSEETNKVFTNKMLTLYCQLDYFILTVLTYHWVLYSTLMDPQWVQLCRLVAAGRRCTAPPARLGVSVVGQSASPRKLSASHTHTLTHLTPPVTIGRCRSVSRPTWRGGVHGGVHVQPRQRRGGGGMSALLLLQSSLLARGCRTQKHTVWLGQRSTPLSSAAAAATVVSHQSSRTAAPSSSLVWIIHSQTGTHGWVEIEARPAVEEVAGGGGGGVAATVTSCSSIDDTTSLIWFRHSPEVVFQTEMPIIH